LFSRSLRPELHYRSPFPQRQMRLATAITIAIITSKPATAITARPEHSLVAVPEHSRALLSLMARPVPLSEELGARYSVGTSSDTIAAIAANSAAHNERRRQPY
jgi:hypothetical protein